MPVSYWDFPWMGWAALLFFHEFPSEERTPTLKQGNGRKTRYNSVSWGESTLRFAAEIFFELIKLPSINPPGEVIEGPGFLKWACCHQRSTSCCSSVTASVKQARRNERRDGGSNKYFRLKQLLRSIINKSENFSSGGSEATFLGAKGWREWCWLESVRAAICHHWGGRHGLCLLGRLGRERDLGSVHGRLPAASSSKRLPHPGGIAARQRSPPRKSEAALGAGGEVLSLKAQPGFSERGWCVF